MNTTVLFAIAAQWGMAVGLHPPAAERFGIDTVSDLAAISSLGADSILLPVALAMPRIDSTTIEVDEETIDDTALVSVIRAARTHRLEVALMPLLTIRDGAANDWRGRIRPRDLDIWWRRYNEVVVHYAAIAESEGVSTLVIGSELSSRQHEDERWALLARRVRDVYGGRLAYVSNHDALDRTAVFRYVDVAGVSAYFPLTQDLDAPYEALVQSWRRIDRRLQAWAAKVERPVVLFEVGYPSLDGAAVTPWDDTIGAPIDLVEQDLAYRAATETMLESQAISGAYFWKWFGPGGPDDRTYTIRNKPAERTLRLFFELTRRRTK